MGYEPYIQNISRYSRTFDPLGPNKFTAPFFFMAAATTGVAGDLVSYSATIENTVSQAASGVALTSLAGFLMQDVKNLDAGALKGWRNPNNSVVNLGDNVGVYQDNGPILTKRYVSAGATLGVTLTSAADGNGRLQATSATTNTGAAVGVIEAVTSTATPTIEPSQYGTAAAPDFIRVRIYAF